MGLEKLRWDFWLFYNFILHIWNKMIKNAIIDETWKYRYMLSRIWNEYWNNFCNFIMLNPSIADDKIDDPTIKSIITIAKNLWYDGIFVTNLFAHRTTDPQELYKDPLWSIWPENSKFILKYTNKCNSIILARGNHWNLISRSKEVIKLIKNKNIYCLSQNKSWEPKHPLYIKNSKELEKFDINKF